MVKAKEPPIIFFVKKLGNDFSFKKKIHRDIKLTPISKAFELILNELHYLSVKSGYSDCCIFKCASNQTSKIEIRPKINTKRVIKKKGKNKRPKYNFKFHPY